MARTTGPIRVVHLITLLELGGAQGNTIHTVTHLDPARFDAHLWCGKGAYWDQDVQASLGPPNRVKFFPRLKRDIHPLYDLLVIVDLWRAFLKFRPDVVHTHSSKAGILGRMAAILAGVPVIIHTFHGFGFNSYQSPLIRRIYVALERWTAIMADALVFVSEANQVQAAELKIGHKSQYHLIRSGIPVTALRKVQVDLDPKRLRDELGIPQGSKVVTTIGAFKPQKNLTDFVLVGCELLKEHPDLTILILGDGVLRPQIEGMIQRSGFESRFKLLGWRRDAGAILSLSDVFVLTSLWEGLPRALVESMVLGVPSVCYESDGVRDLLIKGGGVLIRPGDREGATRSISELLIDKLNHSALSNQARSLIGPEFDIDTMVKQQEQLYQRLLDVRLAR